MRVLALVVVLVGCTQTPQEKSQDVCQAYCSCIEPGGLPGQLESCVQTMCLPQLPPVTDACLTCVFEHEQTCPEMYDQCDSLCLPTGQTPKLGGI